MNNNIEPDICSICYDDLNENVKPTYNLECNHKFHTDCIIKWFRLNNDNCPLCNDKTLDLGNINWGVKLETIKELKKLARSKNCPVKVLKQVQRINKKEDTYNKYKKQSTEFNKQHKEIISTYKSLKLKTWHQRCKIRKDENTLLAIAELQPIYIIKNKKD